MSYEHLGVDLHVCDWLVRKGDVLSYFKKTVRYLNLFIFVNCDLVAKNGSLLKVEVLL